MLLNQLISHYVSLFRFKIARNCPLQNYPLLWFRLVILVVLKILLFSDACLHSGLKASPLMAFNGLNRSTQHEFVSILYYNSSIGKRWKKWAVNLNYGQL
jgi:hypothetical protein